MKTQTYGYLTTNTTIRGTLILSLFTLFFATYSWGQTPDTIKDNTNLTLNFSGNHVDYAIDSSLADNFIYLEAKGGDGGTATITGANTKKARGGEGATAGAYFKIGTGVNEIPSGAIVRFIIGQKGKSRRGSTEQAGSGGGGTGVLYSDDGRSTWNMLVVAGAGGGGYRSDFNDRPGQGGRKGINGGDVANGGNGGNNGNGGNKGSVGAGGGGYLTSGQNTSKCSISGGGAGWPNGNAPTGGNGGCDTDFGFGFGGGGHGHSSSAKGNTGYGAGGGGGYSGGGGGDENFKGGGGGSFVDGTLSSNTEIIEGDDVSSADNGFAQVKSLYSNPPVARCNASLSYHIAAGQTITLSPSDVNNGSSDDNIDLALSLSKTQFNCADIGSQVVTLTITDVTNQTSNCTATVTLTNASPTASCQNFTINLPSSGLTYTLDPASIDDGSSDPDGYAMSYSVSPDAFDCEDYGTTTSVTLTVVDDGNFSDPCTATVTIEDNTTYLTDNNITYTISSSGAYEDFKIPENTTYEDIELVITGADGGTSRFSDFTGGCTSEGGNGATVRAIFGIGNGANEIPKGSIIRFVAGVKGNSVDHGGYEGAGGGGGSAVLYRKVDECTWNLLAVAGGGGGAGEEIACRGSRGKPGNTGTSGTDGKGANNGNGGTNGSGGGQKVDNSGGGGGHTGNGEDISESNCTNQGGGKIGFPEGGDGGKNTGCASSGRKGGFGYGGGGAGEGSGGGGGGYSGGGAGGGNGEGGGGGGSYVNSIAIAQKTTGNGTTRNPDDGGITYKFFTNDPPVAICKASVVVSVNESYNVAISLINNGSYDPDGDPITFSLSQTTLTCSNLGANTVSLYVKDNNGFADTCTSQVTVNSSSFTSLNDGGTEQTLGFSGNYVDRVIPANTTKGQIVLTAWGGDGGKRRVNAGVYNCTGKGGKGAKIGATFNIGCGTNQIPPGSVIRFVVGEEGESDNSGGIEGAGGGGGSAVLYRKIGDCNWNLLIAAGGGGGAYSSGVCEKSRGKEGSSSRSGSGGKNGNSGNGGSNGNGGSQQGDKAAGGGGHTGNGEDISKSSCTNKGGGKKGYPRGGQGGDDSGCANGGREGGFGYGGGGAGKETGGGGGGYSGGGAGGNAGGGGGGGSYIIHAMPTDSVKEERGTTGSPDDGEITYKFQGLRTASSAPTASCKNLTVALDKRGSAVVFPTQINNNSTLGNCSSELIFTFGNNASVTFDCSDLSAAQGVILKAADEHGRSSTCNASITVQDNTGPTLSCPATSTVNGDPISCIAAVSLTLPTATDNCSNSFTFSQRYQSVDGRNNPLSVWSSPSSSTSLNLAVGRYLVEWTGSDANSNTGTCETLVIVNGSATAVLCKNITVQLDANGFATIAASELDNGSSSTCSNIISQSVSPNTFDCANLGSNFVSRTAVSSSGSEGTCTAVVIVEEDQAPQALCQPVSLQLDAEGVLSLATSQVDNGSSDACGTVSLSLSETSFDCSHIGTQTVTLTALDEEGISSQCTAQISIVDITPPAARCQPASLNLDATGEVQIEVLDIENNADDACGIASLSVSPNSFDCSHIGTQTVTLTVTDNSGNTSECSSTVTVSDIGAPTISCPANITKDNDPTACGAIITYAINSSDLCTSTTDQQIDASGYTSGDEFPVGVTHLSYQTTDAAGNTASCSFSVTVNDTTPPIFTCPSDMVLYSLPESCSSYVRYTYSSKDNCQAQTLAILVTLSPPVGVTTKTHARRDAAGNRGNCTFTITVIDAEDPTISCPSTIVQGNDHGVCGAAVTYSVAAADNCSGEQLTQLSGQANGSVFPIGTTNNEFQVTDASGNTASCSFSVTITDTEAPTISCPISLNESNDLDQCGRFVTYLVPIGADNCPGSSTVMTTGLGSDVQFPIGTSTETYTVTDAAGLTASCSFSISIHDNQDPVIALVGENPVILCEGDSYVEAGATAADNCDATVGQKIVINSSAVNTNQEGNYTVTYDVTDIYGNTAIQITRTVIVKHTPAQLAPQNCGACNQIRFDFCEGESVPDLEQLLTANSTYESTVTFRWYADNSNSQGSSISTPIVNTASKNNRFYWVSQWSNGCEGEARRMRVRVRKTSTVVLDLPAIGCNTGQIDLAAWVSDSRGIATSFTFYDADPNLGTSPLGAVSANSGQVNSGQYAVVSLPSQPVTYYAVANNNTGCQVTGSDEVISAAGASLDPVPDITVNAGDLVHVAFNSHDATHILWVNHSSFNNPYVGLLGSVGLGDLLFTAQNSTSSSQTAMIRVIGYNGNCAGQVHDFSITVNPGVGSRQAQNSLQLTASKLNAHDVQLDWDIQYEFKLTTIDIEKQINEGEWETMDHQAVGPDYNLTTHNGTYTDRDGMGNVTKYRLKLSHADGRVIWSQEVEVNFDFFDSKRFTLYPNPSNGRFNLRSAGPIEGEWRYKLSDQLGRTILIGKLKGSETAFDISHLTTGHYFLLLTSPEGKQYLERVVKN